MIKKIMRKRKSLKILKFIRLINKTFERYDNYTGGCFKFHLILLNTFGGEGYYNGNHVITKIDHIFYDVDGIVTDTEGFVSIKEEYGYDFMYEIFKEYL